VVQGGTSKKATREILQTYDAGTLTTDKKVLDLSATWNAAGVTFTGVKFNVTNTASAAASKVFDFQIGGTTQLALTATGLGVGTGSPSNPLHVIGAAAAQFQRTSSGTVSLLITPTGTNTQWSVGAHSDGYFRIANEGVAERLRIDSSGNLGLGVTPSAWTIPAFQSSLGVFAGNTEFNTSANGYYDGAWKYRGTGAASRYSHAGGVHTWFTAPSGTAGNAISFTERLRITEFGLLTFGGTTSSFPALKRSSTTLQVRLADDSAYAPLEAAAGTFSGAVSASASGFFSAGVQVISSDGGSNYLKTGTRLYIQAGSTVVGAITNAGMLAIGGDATSSFPALKRSSTTLQVRLADDSGYAPFEAKVVNLDNTDNGSFTTTAKFLASNLSAGNASGISIGRNDGTNNWASLFFHYAGNASTANRLDYYFISSGRIMSLFASCSVVVNSAAIATSATDGFLYVPTCAGAPTGTPTTQTGTAPIVIDTTNNKLYFYSGGQWRDAGP
jgi:hypothetical protein